MAIINSHIDFEIDEDFQVRHKELLKFFSDKNMDVEITNTDEVKSIILSLPQEDYPYKWDETFENAPMDESFGLLLKVDGEVVSTYAAINMSLPDFVAGMKTVHTGTFEDVSLPQGSASYSSCQWVSKDHRGKKLGMCLDHLKKNLIFDVVKRDVNYSIHKKPFVNYHINGLHYDESKLLATIPKGDKIYYVAYVTAQSWSDKLDDVRKLYS